MQEVLVGSSPDYNPGFSDRLRLSLKNHLTLSGAREAWYEQHRDKVEKFETVRDRLSPAQREAAAMKLERAANKSARGEVFLNYFALASVIGTVYVGGRILWDALVSMPARRQARSFRDRFGSPRDWLNGLLTRAREFAGRFRSKGSPSQTAIRS